MPAQRYTMRLTFIQPLLVRLPPSYFLVHFKNATTKLYQDTVFRQDIFKFSCQPDSLLLVSSGAAISDGEAFACFVICVTFVVHWWSLQGVTHPEYNIYLLIVLPLFSTFSIVLKRSATLASGTSKVVWRKPVAYLRSLPSTATQSMLLKNASMYFARSEGL